MKRAILFTAVSLLSSGVAVCIPQATPVPVPTDHSDPVQPQVVKGAPFTAQFVSENKGTLRDGTEVDVKRAMMQYRDSEGRTRREVESSVVIMDPVAHIAYDLNTKSLTEIKYGHEP